MKIQACLSPNSQTSSQLYMGPQPQPQTVLEFVSQCRIPDLMTETLQGHHYSVDQPFQPGNPEQRASCLATYEACKAAASGNAQPRRVSGGDPQESLFGYSAEAVPVSVRPGQVLVLPALHACRQGVSKYFKKYEGPHAALHLPGLCHARRLVRVIYVHLCWAEVSMCGTEIIAAAKGHEHQWPSKVCSRMGDDKSSP